MNIEEYIKQILSTYKDIEESKNSVEKDSLPYKYIIEVEKKFKNVLELIKTIKINKYEIEHLKLQEERESIMKSGLNKTELDMILIKLNQKMLELNSLRNIYNISSSS
jgi:hypothetical protein